MNKITAKCGKCNERNKQIQEMSWGDTLSLR